MSETKTLDVLPEEGDVETITRKRIRHECEECGEPAHWRVTYLLEGTRGNPASAAYGKDDCSWCSDLDSFVCKEHRTWAAPDGYVPCSHFPATEQFAHMFLEWIPQ